MTRETKVTTEAFLKQQYGLSASVVLQEGAETNQIPYCALLEEHATNPMGKERYSRAAMTRVTPEAIKTI